MTTKKTTEKSTAKDKAADEPVDDEVGTPGTEADKAAAAQLANKDRGEYEAVMYGDSTLVIRYADGGPEDSFTVESLER